MRSSGRCPGRSSSAMPPLRIQSNPTGDSQTMGTLGCPSYVLAHHLAPSSPSAPSPTSQQEDSVEDKWLLYKVSISDSSILYRAGHAPPPACLPPFLSPPNHPSSPGDQEGEEPSPQAFLPTTNSLLFSLFETCSSVCVFQGCTRKKTWEGG